MIATKTASRCRGRAGEAFTEADDADLRITEIVASAREPSGDCSQTARGRAARRSVARVLDALS